MCPNFTSLLLLYFLVVVVYGDVRKPPQITYPRSSEIKYFQSTGGKTTYVDFFCEAEGIPKPSIYWRKNGVLLNETNGLKFDPLLGNITLTDPDIRNEGDYQCLAVNQWGTSVSQPFQLRMARLDSFRYILETTTTAKEGVSVTRKCNAKPESIPSGSYSWYTQSISQQVGTQKQMTETERIAVDKEGSLHFVYVIKSDQLKDEVYACAVTNTFLNSIKIGSKERLEVTESTSGITNLAPSRLYATKNVEAVIGTSVELQCVFGGFPIPKIEWLGLSGETIRDTDKYKIIKFGRSLRINKVEEADEGRYTCIGTGHGRESVVINLNITSPPIWTKPLISHDVIVGDDVTYTCKARSAVREEPIPDPMWFINGEPLNLTKEIAMGRKMSFSDDFMTLTLNAVSRDRDIMCIQCKLTNSIGSVFEDAYLNVLEPIKILSRPPETTIFRHGEVLNFTIRATTDPSQSLSRLWFLNNKVIVPYQPYFTYDAQSGEFYFNTSKVDALKIEDMVGEYRCDMAHLYERVNVTFNVLTSKPTTEKSSDPVVASSNLWIIALIAIVVIMFIAGVVVLALWKQRNPKAVYELGKKEGKHFNLTPIEQLESEELHNETMNDTMNGTMNDSKLSLYSVERRGY